MLALLCLFALYVALDFFAPLAARTIRAARRRRLAEWHAYLDSRRRD